MKIRAIQAATVLAAMTYASLLLADAPVTSREQLNAVLWFQDAPEYKANTAAMYRIATERLKTLRRSSTTASTEQLLSQKPFRKKPRAIILDIDETVLDNSPYNALLIRDGRAYDEAGYKWADWVQAGEAIAIEGAVEFISSARELDYRVLFVTNRECNRDGAYDSNGKSLDCPQKAATRKNLAAMLGYTPDEQDMYFRYDRQDRIAADKLDKQQRRTEIAESFRIAMLIGDDLNDFVRKDSYDAGILGSHWGTDWFVLTNPMYGSWERRRGLDEKYAALRVWPRRLTP